MRHKDRLPFRLFGGTLHIKRAMLLLAIILGKYLISERHSTSFTSGLTGPVLSTAGIITKRKIYGKAHSLVSASSLHQARTIS